MNEGVNIQYEEVYAKVISIRDNLRTCISRWESERKEIEIDIEKMPNCYEKALLVERSKQGKERIYSASKKFEKLLTYIDLVSRKYEMQDSRKPAKGDTK